MNAPAITPTLARRLAVAAQGLAGGRPAAHGPADILALVRRLGCLQLDPLRAVERSHLLVLWSRLGAFDPAALDALLWQDRSLFEYWAHAASIVLTEEYPVHQLFMRRYAAGTPVTARERRRHDWLAANGALRRHILSALRRDGPLPARAFEDRSAREWHSGGWTAGRNVGEMLDYLWTKGRILVAGRAGIEKLWDLGERVLPDWTPRERWTERQVVRYAAQKALRALGVARPAHIAAHYTRGHYPGLERVLDGLERERRIVPVEIRDRQTVWPGPWYVHADDLPLLDRLSSGEWAPRTTLLSPFDNLICDRARAEELFGFRYRIEIYLPPARRRYGYYVMPVLHGDHLIGRVDPAMDRSAGRLRINATHWEPGVTPTGAIKREVGNAIEELAAFLGARSIE